MNTLFFVTVEVDDQTKRSVLAVKCVGNAATLSEKMAKGKNTAGLLGTEVVLDTIAFDRGRMYFYAENRCIVHPVAGIFTSLDQAIPCFEAEQLEVLDPRWVETSMRHVATMQKPFPQAGQCHGNCGQAGCL